MQESSPSRTAGIAMREVTLAGVKYLLSQPDKVRKAADEEAVVISRRLDLLPALAKSCLGMTLEQQNAWRKGYIERMTCGIASRDEWAAYFDSNWRMAFRFWNALDPKHKTMDLLDGVRWAYEVLMSYDVTKEEWQSLELALRAVSQSEQLGE